MRCGSVDVPKIMGEMQWGVVERVWCLGGYEDVMRCGSVDVPKLWVRCSGVWWSGSGINAAMIM